MKKVIGKAMLITLLLGIMAVLVVELGWRGLLVILGVLVLFAWIVVAVNLLTNHPPFEFPGIND